MISPTGRGIRNDAGGSGYFKAPRGNRKHKGVDFEAKVGQEVKAPFDMEIIRIAKPNTSYLSGIAFHSPPFYGKMFYFEPKKELIGKIVKKGEVIGIAQELQSHYGEKVGDHIHVQVKVNTFTGSDYIDPMIIK